MKITEIIVTQKRQVRPYEPVTYQIKAHIEDHEDPELASKHLHALTIRILYRDKPQERDSLIKALVGEQYVPDSVPPTPPEVNHEDLTEIPTL